jgi:hypothetical protein
MDFSGKQDMPKIVMQLHCLINRANYDFDSCHSVNGDTRSPDIRWREATSIGADQRAC